MMHSTCLIFLIIATTIMSISIVKANPTFGSRRHNRVVPYGRGYGRGYGLGHGGYGRGYPYGAGYGAYGGFGAGYGRGYGHGLYRRSLEERDFNQDRSNDALPLSDDWMYQDQDIQNQPSEEIDEQMVPDSEPQQTAVENSPVPVQQAS